MGKVQITLKSLLITKDPREGREPTVFKRSIVKLSEDKKHPGEIIRVYVDIDNDFKVFGAFTINTGGSISFFPDFYDFHLFDHLTLSKNFIKNNGHFTTIGENGKHKKAFHLDIDKLPTGDYSLITFGMIDGDLLMDSLAEVSYPDIEFEDEHETEFLTLLKSAIDNKPIMLSFPEEKGFYCIQFTIFPKGKNINDIPISLGFQDIFSLDKPINEIINAKKIEIKTPESFDFSICIVCFKILQELENPFVCARSGNIKNPVNLSFIKTNK